MIKLMIVDDEPWTRTSLKNRIDWSEEMILCGEASDGFEALELAANLRPDIVITDVRMPEMSGLELIRRLREFLPDIQSVIISGYNEFEYAKSAIELGSCGYVLKPVRKEELNQVIKKAIDNIAQNNLLRLTTQTQAALLDQLLVNLYHEAPVSEESFLSVLRGGVRGDHRTALKRGHSGAVFLLYLLQLWRFRNRLRRFSDLTVSHRSARSRKRTDPAASDQSVSRRQHCHRYRMPFFQTAGRNLSQRARGTAPHAFI